MADTRKEAFIAQFAELLRNAERSGVEDLELFSDKTILIHWRDRHIDTVGIAGDSDAAIIHDVIKKVLK